MTAFEPRFTSLEDAKKSEVFEGDGDRNLQGDWEAIRNWEQERTELLHRIRQSMAVHLEIENRQQQILQRARSYQQLLVQSPDYCDEWLLRLRELNHEFKQADLIIEHEAMKLHFLQRHYNTIARMLEDLGGKPNATEQGFSTLPDRQLDTQTAQESASDESWHSELQLPDYIEPRRLRLASPSSPGSRPYSFLIGTSLQMSQLCLGAIAVCLLLYGLLAVAGGTGPGAIATNFGEFAMRFCSHFLTGVVSFWGFTALWESSR